jgi:predicted nucleic acid-binding protein
MIELEVLYSPRSHADFVQTRATRSRAFPHVPIVQADFDRALDVMEELARRGMHRAAGLPDLLIAAVAKRANLTVLYYDADYDGVVAATGQPTEWVVSRGTVP